MSLLARLGHGQLARDTHRDAGLAAAEGEPSRAVA